LNPPYLYTLIEILIKLANVSEIQQAMRDYERSSQLGVARYSEPYKLSVKLLSHFKF